MYDYFRGQHADVVNELERLNAPEHASSRDFAQLWFDPIVRARDCADLPRK